MSLPALTWMPREAPRSGRLSPVARICEACNRSGYRYLAGTSTSRHVTGGIRVGRVNSGTLPEHKTDSVRICPKLLSLECDGDESPACLPCVHRGGVCRCHGQLVVRPRKHLGRQEGRPPAVRAGDLRAATAGRASRVTAAKRGPCPPRTREDAFWPTPRTRSSSTTAATMDGATV